MGVQGLGEVGERVLVGWVRSDRMDVRYVLLILITGQTCLATQPEAEQVSLSGVYNFLTDDLVARRFYVQIIAQVIITINRKKNNPFLTGSKSDFLTSPFDKYEALSI